MTETDSNPENRPPLGDGRVDLSDLRLMPSWVSSLSTPSPARRYADEDEGSSGRGDRRFGDSDRNRPGGGGGRPGGGQGRGDFRPGGDRNRPGGGGGGGGKFQGAGGGGGGRRQEDRGPRRFESRQREAGPPREWQELPKDIAVFIEPDDHAVDALATHVRNTGHAFSMFDVARLLLAESDRFNIRLQCAPERATGLFCTDDGGVFLKKDEALHHLLQGPALETYYQQEEFEREEPKGDFRSIAVCGMTGELLGPPNHHSFQSTLLRIHRERFSNLPLEEYKRRVRVDTNPEQVAQWKENSKKGVRWVYQKQELAEGEEPLRFTSRAEIENHFRRVHGEDAIREVRETLLIGQVPKQKLTHVLFIIIRNTVESARKHLFEISQKIGGSLERRGLKLFKRRAGKLFVSRVKPRAIDPGVVFSERVARIVETLKGQPGMPLAKLVEAISPGAAPAPEGSEEARPALTDDQVSVIKDVRWLANEGYVIEYTDGMVFLGVQGESAPQKAPAAATNPVQEAVQEIGEKKEEPVSPATPTEEVPVVESDILPEEPPTEIIEQQPADEAPPSAEEPVTETAADSSPEDAADSSTASVSEKNSDEPSAQS